MTLLPPPPPPNGLYSLRFYKTGSATASFADNQWYFTLPYHLNQGRDAVGTPFAAGSVFSGSNGDIATQAWSKAMRITATGADLQYSFDGTTVHGTVIASTTGEYVDRHEGGIYVRGVGATFEIEAW